MSIAKRYCAGKIEHADLYKVRDEELEKFGYLSVRESKKYRNVGKRPAAAPDEHARAAVAVDASAQVVATVGADVGKIRKPEGKKLTAAKALLPPKTDPHAAAQPPMKKPAAADVECPVVTEEVKPAEQRQLTWVEKFKLPQPNAKFL